MATDYRTRLATPDDASLLSEMGRRMFTGMGKPDDERMQQVVEAFIPWVADAIRRHIYIGWIVQSGAGTPVANAGLLLIAWPPNSRDLNPTRGYVMNVWTHPEHRRKGIARRLMEVVMAEAKRRSIRVLALHASDEGKILYDQLGFRDSREMLFVDET